MKKLQAAGIAIAGVGLQDHVKPSWPSGAQIDSTVDALAALGVKVMIAELAVDVLSQPGPDRGGQQQALRTR